MSQGTAKQNLEIFDSGRYVAPSGTVVHVGESLADAKQGTVLYRPVELATLFNQRVAAGATAGPRVDVTQETTGTAISRLVVVEQCSRVAALNFASARNPGGGFLGGAKAQEEDLCRSSALYPTLLTQPDYYDANRTQRSALYTDHMIYSPDVPVFRDESGRLLDQPFLTSFITAPAPNAGAVAQNEPDALSYVLPTLQRRIRNVLAVAADRNHRVLVLGAWGCGVFRNDPAVVASAMRQAFLDPRFAGAFDRVVFAIYDSSKDQRTFGAFLRAFDHR